MNAEITVPPLGKGLRDWLFDQGVEFPCGGVAGCGGCRVRLVSGYMAITPEMREILTEEELAAGWRLGCQAEANEPVVLEIEQWHAPVLTDHSPVPVEPRPGTGAVIDLGTTTIVVQAVDLQTGEILAVETALNAQAAYGADIMSRVEYALKAPGELTAVIRSQLEILLRGASGGRPLEEILIVGNTVMHHLCGGLDVAPLAAVPFRSPALGAFTFPLCGAPATFLGCAGGFVGSDLLAGLCATGFDRASDCQALMDLGTNGEIAVGNHRRIRVASTAAGPAFEAGRIRQGMRAMTGAIDRVDADRESGGFEWRVIGGVPARGICGSGLVDAIAAALTLGSVSTAGAIQTSDRQLHLGPAVTLIQRDVRELQLAKGAVATGYQILSDGQAPRRLWLAGAFGNYVRARSAQAIGLLPADGVAIESAGNTALRGARQLLLQPSRRDAVLAHLHGIVEHVELAALPEFTDAFVGQMPFPETRF
jgi:uncharacterized 2Fe-2S/4Fe-4S cluster protein (DUF4445 family)